MNKILDLIPCCIKDIQIKKPREQIWLGTIVGLASWCVSINLALDIVILLPIVSVLGNIYWNPDLAYERSSSREKTIAIARNTAHVMYGFFFGYFALFIFNYEDAAHIRDKVKIEPDEYDWDL